METGKIKKSSPTFNCIIIFAISTIIACLLFIPLAVDAAFYICTDKEGNELLSDHPRHGQVCKQLQGYDKATNSRGENAGKATENSRANVYNKVTNIMVEGNRVMIPVTIINQGSEIVVRLIMDTGAEGTTISAAIADRLYINVNEGRKGKARVVGGGIIDVSVVKIDSLIIGPHIIPDYHIVVVPHEGAPLDYDGLLGMDVLGKYSYRIDLSKRVIIWE